jgi:quercetin dioxygenase-like cupin family protein
MLTIEPHPTHKPVIYKHEGEASIHVISGVLELTLGSKGHFLEAGEHTHFNSHIPHKLKNLFSEQTRFQVVLYTV